jgi:pimeloyl-ACP methyl ester carboxylesterase
VRALYRSPADAAHIQSWCRQRLEAWTVRHDTDRLETSLGHTHLTWAGTAEEALCLYLPGTTFNAATSTTLLTRLGVRWRVLCPDLPGQPGLSAATRPVDEVTDYPRWMADLLEHARRQHPDLPVVVVAHSRGAAAALLANPTDVDGLVLVSPAGLAKVRLSHDVLLRSMAWLLRPTPARSRRLVDLMAGGGGADLEPLVEWLTLVARSTRATGAPGPLPARTLDRWHDRSTRVLVGERDVFFTPAMLAEPARRLGTTLDAVPDVGHLLTDQRPDLVVAAVSEVLSEHGPTRPLGSGNQQH